jgi:hypothetical protein
MSARVLQQRAPGLATWCADHPAGTPGRGWERSVRAYLVAADDATVLVDPIAPAAGWDELDEAVERHGRAVVVLLSRAGHFRDAGELARRYAAAVHGHPAAADRGAPDYRPIAPRDRLPGDVDVLAFDVPGLDRTPLYLTSHRAIAPGDILVRAGGALRLWWVAEDESDERFLAERHIPTLRRWLDDPVDHVLTAHGAPVVGDGGRELEAAFGRPPWDVS